MGNLDFQTQKTSSHGPNCGFLGIAIARADCTGSWRPMVGRSWGARVSETCKNALATRSWLLRTNHLPEY